MGSSHHTPLDQAEDPCAGFGTTQRWAVVWLLGVLIAGSILVTRLARIDTWMYATNAEFLDYDKYRENRLSQTLIASEGVEPASRGGLNSALASRPTRERSFE